MAARKDQRRMTVMLALLGVLVLVFLVRQFGAGGGGDDDESGAPRTTTTPTTAEAPTTVPGEEPGTEPDEFDVFATRNPFEPVVGVPPSSPPLTTVPPTTTPGAPTTTAPSVPPTTSGTFEPGGTQIVSLLDISEDAQGLPVARVQVGSTVYTVYEGDTFATSYEVVSLDAETNCGEFLYGDSPFDLCEGQQTVK